MGGVRELVRQLLPASRFEFPPEKCGGSELRFRGAEFDEALLLPHLQRHSLLQLRRPEAVLRKVRRETDDTCCSK